MTSYSTAFGLRYPLTSIVYLDEEYQGEGRYAPDGNEGPWYVAGWSGKDGIRLNRVRDLALVGVWEYCATEQRVIGSPAWERTREEIAARYPLPGYGILHLTAGRVDRSEDSDPSAALDSCVARRIDEAPGPWWRFLQAPAPSASPARSVALEPTIEAPGVVVAYLDRESWSGGEYEDYRAGETLADLLRVNPCAATLRREWALSKTSTTLAPYRYLFDELPHRATFGMTYAMWTRYVRRGVCEPWQVFELYDTEYAALVQIDGSAKPLCAQLEVIQQARRERADFEAIQHEEEQARKEAARVAQSHRDASEAAFSRMYHGKDPEGRYLAEKWGVTMKHLMDGQHEELRKSLYTDTEFRAKYDAVMSAEKVASKRRAVKECLKWLRVYKRINVEPEPTVNDQDQDKESRQS